MEQTQRSEEGFLYPLPLLLENVGVLCSRELLTRGDLHHICIELEPVAVRINEIERSAAAAAQEAAWPIAPLRSMNQGSLDNMDSLLAQIGERLQPLVATVDFQRNMLK